MLRTLPTPLVLVLVLIAAGSVGTLAQDTTVAPSDLSIQTVPSSVQAVAEVQTVLGTGFTYQGRLLSGGVPLHGTCDLQFALWDGPSGGTQVGTTQTLGDVSVANGLFTVTLNGTGEFGPTPFDGQGRYLETTVRCPAGTGAYTMLVPRQELTAAPYAHFALDAGRLGGTVATAYQQRVDGACPVGSSIRAVSADGTVTCQRDAPLNRSAPPADNVLTTIGAADNYDPGASVTVGADGLPVIAFYDDSGSGALKVAHCDDPACTSATISVPDSNRVGMYPSIAIAPDGLPVISHLADSTLDLRLTRCNDAACSSATNATIVSTGAVGWKSSIAVGADGLPVVSHNRMGVPFGLLVTHCDDPACSSATTTTIDDFGGVVVRDSSIAIGGDGLPVIAYAGLGSPSYSLNVAHCGDPACSTFTIATPEGSWAGDGASVVIGADGLPLVSYLSNLAGDLKVAHCSDVTCASATTSTIDYGGVGYYTSATIGADGLAVISYHESADANIKVAHCRDVACTSASTTTLDGPDAVGEYNAITIGTDGLPLVVYHDDTNSSLKAAHCANLFCTPYIRRR